MLTDRPPLSLRCGIDLCVETASCSCLVRPGLLSSLGNFHVLVQLISADTQLLHAPAALERATRVQQEDKTGAPQWQVGREARLWYGSADCICHISMLRPVHLGCARQCVCAQRGPAAHHDDRHVLCTAKHQSQAEPPMSPCQHAAGGRARACARQGVLVRYELSLTKARYKAGLPAFTVSPTLLSSIAGDRWLNHPPSYL